MFTPLTRVVKDWISGVIAARRTVRELNDDLDADRVAHELGMPLSELHAIAIKGPGAAALLGRRMKMLGLDDNDLTWAGITTKRDLQRICAMCHRHRRCAHDLDQQDRSDRWTDYCPNTYTLLAVKSAQEKRERSTKRCGTRAVDAEKSAKE